MKIAGPKRSRLHGSLGLVVALSLLGFLWQVAVLVPQWEEEPSMLASPAESKTSLHQPQVPVRPFKKTRKYIQEMPQAKPPPIYVMIPSVPRKENADYLLTVLESLGDFPKRNVYVFHNNDPNQTHHHVRWEEARTLFPTMHFLTHHSPLPPPHEAAYNVSLPLPAFVQNVTLQSPKYAAWVAEARKDPVDRKNWRRKECFDFLGMTEYMLDVIRDDDAPANKAWLILNQDDAQWKVSFLKIWKILTISKVPRVDLHRDGMVSVAFRADKLEELVAFATRWCDFLPVDWMTRLFVLSNGYCKVCDIAPPNFVTHIGDISSKYGRVEGAEEAEQKIKEQRRGKRPVRQKVIIQKNLTLNRAP